METTLLTREYVRPGRDARIALRDVGLAVPEGEVHGLLGPNGAGKTTLCKILSTVLEPTSGSARVLGRSVVEEPKAIRREIGIAFGGDRGLYGRLTVEQNLRYWCALFGMRSSAARRRTQDVIQDFGLQERATDRVETLSRGWKQRVHLARAVVGRPRLLILDEPTAGLDPVAARAVRDLVSGHIRHTCTVLLSTHDMREAESLCDRVTVIGRGLVLATGAPATLAQGARDRHEIRVAQMPDDVRTGFEATGELHADVVAPGAAHLRFASRDALTAGIERLLRAGVTEFDIREPSLEDFYLDLLGDRGIGE